jgi:hypothetical protein
MADHVGAFERGQPTTQRDSTDDWSLCRPSTVNWPRNRATPKIGHFTAQSAVNWPRNRAAPKIGHFTALSAGR